MNWQLVGQAMIQFLLIARILQQVVKGLEKKSWPERYGCFIGTLLAAATAELVLFISGATSEFFKV